MSTYHRRWPIAGLLFSFHLPFVVGVWALFVLLIASIIGIVAYFGTVSISFWANGAQIGRWFAIGYGYTLIKGMLPLFVAHGQTRREFLTQGGLYMAVAVVVFAALVTLGHVLEVMLFQAMDWQAALAVAQTYGAADRLPLTFFSTLAWVLAWFLGGVLLGAGVYRADGWSLLAVGMTIMTIGLAGISVNRIGLPFVDGLLQWLNLSPVIAVPVTIACFVVSLALAWIIIRDIPIQTKPV